MVTAKEGCKTAANFNHASAEESKESNFAQLQKPVQGQKHHPVRRIISGDIIGLITGLYANRGGA